MMKPVQDPLELRVFEKCIPNGHTENTCNSKMVSEEDQQMMTPVELYASDEDSRVVLKVLLRNGYNIKKHDVIDDEDVTLYPGGIQRSVHDINIREETLVEDGYLRNHSTRRNNLLRCNGELRHSDVICSKNRLDGYKPHVQCVSKSGLRLQRYLPTRSEPDLNSAIAKAADIVNSISLEEYTDYKSRYKDTAIYRLPQSIVETGKPFKTSLSVGNSFKDQRTLTMSNKDESLGVTNPIFVDDTQDETHSDVKTSNNDSNKNSDVINSDETERKNGDVIHENEDAKKNGDVVVDMNNLNRKDSKRNSKKSDKKDTNENAQVEEVTINVGSDDNYVKPLSNSTNGRLSTSGKYRIEESFAKANSMPSTDAKDEDTKWLEWMEKKFKEIAGADGQIDLQEFKKALGVKKSFFAERFFELFDQDHSGAIELGELMDGLRMLTKGTPAQKLQFLFDVYDADGSGSIDRDELKEVLKACMEESSLSLTDENIDDLTDVLFDAADEDESGEITFDELRKELEKHPGVIENLTISAAQWLKPPDNGKGDGLNHRYLTAEYHRNNIRKVAYLVIYILVNVALFIVAVWQYRESNEWIQVARGCGLCLNFNGMWVLVLMLRKCLTFVRMTKLNHVLPLDQHILFHKITGMVIALFSLVHTLAHIGNAATVGNGVMEMWEVLFTAKAGVGFVGGSAFITGWLLDIILIIMVICSLEFVRRGGHFQVFYWTHMLYVAFWILLLLHGPHFWKWFVVPGAIFILEKVFRSKLIKMARYGDTYIEEVNLLPSKVTHLVVTRPLNFKYQPGDYIFIQIPAIAQQEWHPFTISSAPEMEGQIWLHVRSAGHWTNKLYEYFDKLEVTDDEQKSFAKSRRSTKKFEKFERAYSRRPTTKRTQNSKKGAVKPKLKHKVVKVKCYIDGPYGTGTREVFNVQHAVLIGAGIGVTPMAAILQSVWYKFNETRTTCPKCAHVWYNEEETEDMKLKKVDFIWINRDQKSFEWFLTLLNQLELEQTSHHGALENCIQTHLYMTAAQKKTDMKGIGLQIALDLMYEKSHVDLITGLRTKTNPGRPDWNKIFTAIKEENKGKVKVFFCGAPGLGKQIKTAAEHHNFAFSKENF